MSSDVGASTETVKYEVDEGVATITLNRPEQLNTMSPDLLASALIAMSEAASDDKVRAVILTGAGRGFCAGGDLGGMSIRDTGVASKPRPLQADIAHLRSNMRTSQLLRDMPKVTFAAINGPCAGAGFAWACACDIRYCSESAVFNTAFMTAGLSGDFGGTWTLPRIVGAGKARELYLLADKFRAPDALRIGLVSEVLPDDQLLDYVRAKAARVAGFAPLTLQAIKANLNDAFDVDFSTQLDREADRHIRTGRTHDAKEAAMAFLEKRPGKFIGR
jgi:2-(1,2-epoxy-1,2-dihydrophenyl)acetyl-CoA isomerase